ncbi:MAG: hypothetical protein FWF56_00145 [Firmicutes bacterium]|nr:hypothetical protein [Bacillota bacterium]
MPLHIIENFIVNLIGDFCENIWLGLLLAPLLGILMSFTPCCLAHAGVAMHCVDGDTKNKRFGNSMLFVVGGVVFFALASLLVGLLGAALSNVSWLMHVLLGVLLIVSIGWVLFFNKKHSQLRLYNHATTTKSRMLINGFVGAIFVFPSNIPILLAFFAFAQISSNIVLGVAMLALYIIGHSVLIVVGVSSKPLFSKNDVAKKVFIVLRIVVLLIMLCYAFLLIFNGLYEKFGDNTHHMHEHILTLLSNNKTSVILF